MKPTKIKTENESRKGKNREWKIYEISDQTPVKVGPSESMSKSKM